MSGSVLLDSASLGSANAALAFGPTLVGGIPTGSYAGTFGTPVSWTGFDWDTPVLPGGPLWTFTSGLWTYNFVLSSVSVASQNNSFLNLLGSGTLDIVGLGDPYDPTPGYWSFTISNPGGGDHANFAFTFANAQTAAVPDGGATAMLLGVGLVAFGALRRKA
jgi:hypothetical protein